MSMLDILKKYAYPEFQSPSDILIKYSNFQPDIIHIFSEGITDEVFYRQFISKYYKGYKLKFWVCGNRQNVESLLILFKANSKNWTSININNNRSRLLFIIDRDFYIDAKKNNQFKNASLINDDADTYENVFITELHSIENYIAGVDGFKFLLKNLFRIEDVNEVQSLIKDYQNQYSKFLDFYLYCYFWLDIVLQGKPRNIKDKIYENSLTIHQDINIFLKNHLLNTDGKLKFDVISNILKDLLKPHELTIYNTIDKIQFEQTLNSRFSNFKSKTIEEKRFLLRGKDDLWFLIWFHEELLKKFIKILEQEQRNTNYKIREEATRKIKITKGGDMRLHKNNAIYILGFNLKIPVELKTFLTLNSKNWKLYIQQQATKEGIKS